MHSYLDLAPEIKVALSQSKPVVALESTIISHGLPWPENLSFAKEAEAIVRKHGAVPATIAVYKGRLQVGCSELILEEIAKNGLSFLKLSSFDLPYALGLGLSGSTTVAGTMAIASAAGIKVFATGGIGGVHRDYGSCLDISHDLEALSREKMIVVCAGAKSILDIGSTLEFLETKGVLTVGYQTNDFAGFYSQKTGFSLPYQVGSPEEISKIFSGPMRSSLLVINPIPKEHEIPFDQMDSIIQMALAAAKKEKIIGKQVTPFLLAYLKEATKGRCVEANLALVRNNVTLATQIANALQHA